jgi:hypothetical protein
MFALLSLSHRFRKLTSGKRNLRRRAAPARSWHRLALHGEPLEDRRLMAVDVILEWNDVLLEANARDHARTTPQQGGPILTARAFAITSAAMYDAYNSVNHIGDSYLVSLNVKGADVDAAVAQAAYTTLVALYPAQRAMFNESLTETLARIPNGKGETMGRALGAFVGLRYLIDRHNDGAADLKNNTYVYNGLPGFHDVDPLHPGQGFYASSAMNVDPFVVDSLSQFAARRLDDGTPEGRMAFMSSAEYTSAYKEVLALGGTNSGTERTPEQTEIGIYWAYDGRPGLGTPPRLYNQIVQTIAVQQHNSEAQNARLFALVNIAMFDAGLTSWKNKYDDAFWRPVMGIRNGESDENPETIGIANWTPLGAPASNPRPGETNFTPPFPSYTSGHATFGAATFQILTRFYGRDDIPFTFVSDELNGVTRDADGSIRPLVSRSFDSFTEAKLENGQSRIYLGIHWAFDRDDGIRTGDNVADFVFDHALRPARRTRSVSLASLPDDRRADEPKVVQASIIDFSPRTAQTRPLTESPPMLVETEPLRAAKKPAVDGIMHEIGESEESDASLDVGCV